MFDSGSERRPTGRGFRGRAVFAALVAICTFFMPLATASPALANPSAGFNPSHIISDGNFYNGDGMSVAQIQSFLNQRVPRCTIGDPGREPWSPWGGTFVASTCLKSATFSTASRAANAYCKAYPGGTRESVATIISKVSRSCGISPQVLLVMLEKEQSLITDTWPTARQYDVAMGYACPDSGPNNSANCDPTQTGFPQQVYRAAWQLQVYKAHPNSYNYKPFKVNTIQWHPNAGCGTSQVYIENWATAALYIYTPYRPNQAALNAGWGTGDGCSSYGNRNFYNFYNQWFGSPTLAVDPKFTTLYNANTQLIGEPISNAVSVAGGLEQTFTKGRMYWHSSAGASFVSGGVLTAYLARSGPEGALGFPRGVLLSGGGGWYQQFQRGSILWKSGLGARQLSGGINASYFSMNGPTLLGYPIADMTSVPSGGWLQEFERGILTWGAPQGGVRVAGGMLSHYRAHSGATTLGVAKGGEQVLPGGWVQPFSQADLYWRNGSGTRVLSPIRDDLSKLGGSASLGLPKAEEARFSDGTVRQDFDRATVLWSREGGLAALSGQMLTHYLKVGPSAGGFPLGTSRTVVDGVSQEFTRGTFMVSPRTPMTLVAGGIRTSYLAAGGAQELGFPLSPEVKAPTGEWRQEFERGTVVWSGAGGGAVLTGDIREAFLAGQLPSAGMPKGSSTALRAGSTQVFTKATVFASSSGVFPVTGGIRNEFTRRGGVDGVGYPVNAEARRPDGSWAQRFELGEIVWSASGVSYKKWDAATSRGASGAVPQDEIAAE